LVLSLAFFGLFKLTLELTYAVALGIGLFAASSPATCFVGLFSLVLTQELSL
jgi:hypothetical protein